MIKRSILQTKAWENFQKDLGKTVFLSKNFEKSSTYAYLAILETTPIGNYLFVPYGPVAKNKKELKRAITELKSLAKKQNAFFVRIEPFIHLEKSDLKSLGGKKTKDVNPAETWVVDLPKTREELNKKFPKRLRGYYNTHEKKGVEILISENPEDIRHLVRLQKETFSQKKIQPYAENYLKKEAEQDFSVLYLAKYEDDIIAAVLVFDDTKTRYYMQAASDKKYAKLNANGVLTIQAMIDAQAKGLEFFDFWGIAPKNAPADHPWSGFTHFKKMFQGEEQEYCGTIDIPLNKTKYAEYRLLTTIKRKINKVKSR